MITYSVRLTNDQVARLLSLLRRKKAIYEGGRFELLCQRDELVDEAHEKGLDALITLYDDYIDEMGEIVEELASALAIDD